MRRSLPALAVLVSLVAAPAVTTVAGGGAAAVPAGSAAEEPRRFEPRFGVTFNDPTTRRSGRVILREVLRSVEAAEPGEQVRLATWSYDDERATELLVAAAARGVRVQVVVSNRVTTESWATLRRALNRDDSPDTFAVRCDGGCRSRARIMHTKLYLFSRVGEHTPVSMISSSNITEAARHRQWNDLLTTRSPEVYAFLGRIFDEYAQDTPVAEPSEVETLGDFRVWAYPVEEGANPQLAQLDKVRCHGATGGTGTRDGRTRIRIAVAGWFDAYGQVVADRLRLLWDRGCDVRVVTTLAGRGINQTLKAGHGRGPVPIRRLAFDRSGDGLPDRYLHQKSMAISGVFGRDTSASVVLTGSPNWSSRAARSEEVWVRVLDRPRLTRRYLERGDRLFRSPFSSSRLLTPARLHRSLDERGRPTGPRVPSWLELD